MIIDVIVVAMALGGGIALNLSAIKQKLFSGISYKRAC